MALSIARWGVKWFTLEDTTGIPSNELCSNCTHPEKDAAFTSLSSRNAQQTSCSLESQAHMGLHEQKHSQQVEGSVYSPWFKRESSSQVLCPALDSSVQATPTNWRKSSRGLWRQLRSKSKEGRSRRGWGKQDFSVLGRLRENTIAVYNYLMKGYREIEPGSFQWCTVDEWDTRDTNNSKGNIK